MLARSRPAPSTPESAGERRRFLAHEFLGMFDAGILTEDDRVELVEGELLTSTKVRSSPAPSAARARSRSRSRHRARASRSPPDGRRPRARRRAREDSHVRDRTKLHDYARGGVPVYWLLDLRARALEVFRDPDPQSGLVRRVRVLEEDDETPLPELSLRFSVASFLP